MRKVFLFYVVGIIVTLSFAVAVNAQDDEATIDYDPDDVQEAWENWRDRQITDEDAGDAPRMRVMGGVDDESTVSEGQAYGMLYAALFDEQDLFDGLWLFAADHLNNQGLMHWHIGDYGELRGMNDATDAATDMGLALVHACVKVEEGVWPESTNDLDYCEIGQSIINAMWEYEIDHPGPGPQAGLDDNQGFELIPGDQWNLRAEYPEGITNLSYFAPGYYRIFAEFTDNPGWLEAIDRSYEIANLAQAKEGNCSNLVSNWNQYDGDPQVVPWQGDSSAYFGWDAGRFAWRVAVDQAWYASDDATETMNEIGGFFASVGIDNVRAEYRLDGTAVNTYTNVYFLANAAAAIWAAPDPTPSDCGDATGSIQTTPQEAYDAVLNMEQRDYYGDAWRLFAMLLLTDNFPNPYADEAE